MSSPTPCPRICSFLSPRLIVGSAVGSIREIFAKIKSIDQKHGKFDLVLCLGDFFGPPRDAHEAYEEDHEVMQLLDGRLEGRVFFNKLCMYAHLSIRCVIAPVECYIMQGEHPLPAPVIEKFAKTGGPLSKNVFLLRECCVYVSRRSH